MFSILLSWIFITCISYSIGLGIHTFLKKFSSNENSIFSHFTLLCISGLLVTSFLSSVLCLFIPLALVSNIIVLLISLFSAVVYHKNLIVSIQYNISLLKKTPLPAVIILILFLFVITRLSYTPSSHNDDGLYYSTSIKWLQEYGTVKGLANINPRIAFNSTWLILQAQYGFQFLNAGLFNDLNGLLLFYLLIYSCGGVISLIKGHVNPSAILRAIFMLPALSFHHTAASDFMIFNVNFLGSPTADIPAALLMWLIVVLFLETNNSQSSSTGKIQSTDILVIFYIISAITIKLIAVPMVLLILFYCYRQITAKQFKNLSIIFLICTVPVIPWIIRNVLLSGYLLFPFSSADWLRVDWKLPIENVYWHENAVKEFVVNSESGNKHWIKDWVIKQNYINTVLLILILLSTFTYIFLFVYQLFKRNFSFLSLNGKLIMIILTLLSGIIFWFLKGPDFRFGYGYTVIYCMLALSLLLNYFLSENAVYAGWLAAMVSACILYFVYANDFTAGIRELTKPPLTYRLPQQMKQVALTDKQPIHLATGADIWNAPLPAATEEEYLYIKPTLRTQHIKDGFKALNQKH